MKIGFFGLEKEDQAVFSDVFEGTEVLFFEEKLDENTVVKARNVNVVCVFVDSTVNQTVIDAIPNLKFIATRSTGLNHIACDYAKTKGVQVSYVPGYGSHTVAEFTFGLILNLSRKIIIANDYITQTLDFNYNSKMQGFNLAGKTLGVIGTGKIGKNVVKIAKGFEMNVIAYDHYPDEVFAKETGVVFKNFDDIITDSDIISLHAPFVQENFHLINKENIQKMKKGVYLINTARGELIDTAALLFGLREGIIAGAGLDVLEGEKDLKANIASNFTSLNKELMKMPNVIITPHTAFYTLEAVAEIYKITILNLQAFLANAPINLVK